MTLAQQEIVPYLLDRRLIRAGRVVDGDLSVFDVSRRNCNFKVVCQEGPSYLLKQGIGPQGIATVAHEGAVYRYFQSTDKKRVLESCLPICHGYDERCRVLILELLHKAESLRAYHARLRRFPPGLAMLLGDALAELHSLSCGDSTEDARNRDPDAPPWVLSIHRPHLSALREISRANLELMKVLQSSAELCQNLDEVRQGWRVDAFIHRDIKGENIVISARPGGRRKPDVKIVDWECAGFGDACWDVGSLLGEYLSSWLFSIPFMAEDPPDRFIHLAGHPLETIQPAMLAFWKAYAGRMRLALPASQQWLIRAVRYAAARILQTAYESLQQATRCTGNILYLVQICANILQKPREASVHLFGIPGPSLGPQ